MNVLDDIVTGLKGQKTDALAVSYFIKAVIKRMQTEFYAGRFDGVSTIMTEANARADEIAAALPNVVTPK